MTLTILGNCRDGKTANLGGLLEICRVFFEKIALLNVVSVKKRNFFEGVWEHIVFYVFAFLLQTDRQTDTTNIGARARAGGFFC